jgi:predicted MPP superfamily phosphohydrolase
MLFFVFLIIIEVLSFFALKDALRERSRGIFFTAVIIHGIISFCLWLILVETVFYKSFFDTPEHISMLLNLTGIACAVVFPRFIIILFHYTGKLFRIKKSGHIKYLTNTGFVTAILISSVITLGSLYGRFNFRTENVEIPIKNLHKDLDGIRIVQISDLHLASFYNHGITLQKVMDEINLLKPDLILNTGDFVSFGWREFGRNDTILSKAGGRYGSFAVMGNHDFGTYHPFFTEADRNNNVLIINNMIKSSGYTVLNDTNTIIKINEAKIGLTGIITKGRHPYIVHGNLKKALAGLDGVDLKILLSHDPNQWEEEVVSKTNIDLTLSGHTHGMQMGINTKKFKWSPSKYFYPHWGGLYKEGKQFQYVNLGLGVLAIPFRICMPPEITVITLKRE